MRDRRWDIFAGKIHKNFVDCNHVMRKNVLWKIKSFGKKYRSTFLSQSAD